MSAVADLDVDSLHVLVDTVAPPPMSDPARTFVLQLFEANRRRLLDEFSAA